MTKKNTDTTNVYERVSKSELFAYMNSLASTPEKDRLYRAFLRNVDLFKTIRHGKTIILGIDAAKKHIENKMRHVFIQFLTWAMFVSVGACMMVWFALTINQYPVITFSNILPLILMGFAELFVVVFLIRTLVEKKKLNISEEHIDRGINPDYFDINFEINGDVSYHSFTDEQNIVIVRTQII